MRLHRKLAGLAIGVSAAATLAIGVPAGAVTAPFVASTVNATTHWCPNFHADSPATCSTDNQNQTFNTVPYAAANVTISAAGYISLNQDASHGAAVNTQGQASWPVGTTIGEKLNIKCNASGVPYGWFAYWTDSTPGASGGGEIDIAEGLDQSLKWGIHVGSIALPASGNAYPDKCGVHDFKVIWDTTKAAFYEDGTWYGKVTATDVQNAGGSWITANQRIIDDFGRCSQTWCNPGGSGQIDQVESQWTS